MCGFFFALPELIWLSPQFTDKRHKEINQPDPIHTWEQRGGRIEGREEKKKEKQASATWLMNTLMHVDTWLVHGE